MPISDATYSEPFGFKLKFGIDAGIVLSEPIGGLVFMSYFDFCCFR